MGKKMKPSAIDHMNMGSLQHRALEREEISVAAQRIINDMPRGPERVSFIRNLTTKALRGEVALDVFKEVISKTNSWSELELVGARAKLLAKKK
jgi:hypothetical protein